MRKVIFAGGRDFTNKELLSEKMLSILAYSDEPVTVVTGGARGADMIANLVASELGLPRIVLKAEWDKYGKSAGYRRNVDMADIATELVAFWDGVSKGTKHMIDIARSKKLKTTVIYYNTTI